MIEKFLDWYTEGDSIINPAIAGSLTYVEYEGVFGLLAIFAVLFEGVRNAVKSKVFTVSEEWIIGVFLLLIVGGSLKPIMDGIGIVTKQLDEATALSDDDKKIMVTVAVNQRRVALSNDIDSLVNQNDGGWNLQTAKKQIELWVNDFKLAGVLVGASPDFAANPLGGFITTALEDAIGSFRALLKIYYIAMMNILYLIVPIAYVMSVFKPAHFLKPLGLFLMYGLILSVINFIQWAIYTMFIGQTVGATDMVSMILSPGAILFELMGVFLYLRAFYFARLMIPIPAEDTLGPMVGQALGVATYAVGGAVAKMATSMKGSAGGGGSSKGTDGPVDVTK